MWYYLENEQQRGPVMDADLETLRRDGKINPDTLIWREGMAEWRPLREAQPGAATVAAPTAAPPMMSGVAQVVCSQCGGVFPASEVIRYGNAAVCAACKPIFVQKLKEGANVAGGPMEFAGFWTRFAAYFVDGIITNVIATLVRVALGAAGGMAAASGGRAEGFIVMQFVGMALGLVITASYYIYFIGKDGQTPGKKLCKIRVVSADGSPVSYGKATGRYFGYWLSSLILGIGFLMAAWDEEKRTLHDRLCNTRVVKV